MHGPGGTDPFEEVKGFLEALGGRRPRKDEIREITPALHAVYRRFMRMRAYAPAVELGEEVWHLMELAGVQQRPSRLRVPFRRAAML